MIVTSRIAEILAVLTTLLVVPSVVAREWKDASGTHSVDAEFVSFANGKVTLLRSDTRKIVVPLVKLSAADQEFVRQQAPEAVAEDEASPFELLEVTVNQPKDDSSKLPKHDGLEHSGVTLAFEVSAGERHFIGFDEVASEIVACKDDVGTDLTTETRVSLFYEFHGPLDGTVLEGGQKCHVLATVPGVPGAGATKIKLQANLAIRCAKETKTEEQRDVPLESGSEVTVGPVPLKIESVKDYNRDGYRQAFQLVSYETDDAIKSIAFLGSDGKVLVHNSLGGLITSCGKGCYRNQSDFALRQKVEKVTMRVTYYSDVETITVPVTIETGEGF